MRAVLSLLLAGFLASVSFSAHAQLADKKALTLAEAKKVAAAAAEEAKKNNWTMAIAIVDDGGNLQYFEKIDETQVGSVQIAIDKAKSALLFKRPTKVFEDAVLGGRTVILSLHDIVPIEGGVPLMAGGKVIGAIGVSGGTAPQDGVVAAAGVAALPK
jgi:glc operon protein GlcG